MKYILENERESSRLKDQESIPVYNLKNDLTGFEINNGDTVLDAGCGAGVISLYLKKNYSFKQLYACDFSELRLKQAENFLKENGVYGTKFFQCDLSKNPQQDNTFSKIVCRFVYEYLPDPLSVSKEFHRVCTPGGQIRLIDLDGVVFNLHTQNKKLTEMLDLFTKHSFKNHHLDFFAGRKMYTYLKLAGFKDVQYSVRPMVFQGDDLKKEHANYEERFRFARAIIDDAFKDKADYFIEMYLDELKNEQNLLFYNNFVVTGTK
ncbi:MAG: methyltransferase domain-containing protein [Bacteriovoracaceae bacterium]